MNYLEVKKKKDDWLNEISPLPSYVLKKDEKTNNIINVAVAGIVTLAIRPPLYLLPIFFIGFDAICSIANIFIYRVLPESRKNCEDIKKLEKRNKTLEKLIESAKKKVSDAKSFSEQEIFKDYLNFYEKQLKTNNKKIKTITEEREKKAREEEEALSLDNIYKGANKEKLDQYKAIIEKIKEFITKEDEVPNEEGTSEEVITKDANSINDGLKALLQGMNNVLEMLYKKPENINYVNSTFNVYGEELIRILNNVESMTEKERKKYTKQIEELVNEYVNYLKSLEEKIQKDTLFQTEVDINILMNELRKARERS